MTILSHRRQYVRTFHDSTLTQIIHQGTDISFLIEDVSVQIDSIWHHESGKLTINGISKIKTGDNEIETLQMLTEYGDIMSLTKTDHRISIAIDWIQDFNTTTPPIASIYEVIGDNVMWTPETCIIEE